MKAEIEHWPVAARVGGETEREAAPSAGTGSLAEIYDAHFDFVWRNARRLGVPEASADDVVQDVFIVVQRRLPDFDGRVQLRAWIFGILTRVARDHRRSFRRKGSRCVPLSQTGSLIAPEPTPRELAERAERVQLLELLLSQLDEDKRTLLVLSELEEWTLREIAEFFGSNTNTIYSRLRAAKRDFDRAYARWLGQAGETREQDPDR